MWKSFFSDFWKECLLSRKLESIITVLLDFQLGVGELDPNQKTKAATVEEPETELTANAKDTRLVKGKSMPSLR